MEKKKVSISPMLIVVIVLGLILAAVVALALNFHLVDFKLYARGETELDLRGQEITASHHDKLRQAMPDCIIHWDIPFQGKTVPDDITELTVSAAALTQDDMLALTYLPNLQIIHAEACEDYAAMAAVQQMLPQVQVRYNVTVGQTQIFSEDEAAMLGNVSAQELGKLDYLPRLKTISVTADCADPAAVEAYCAQRGLAFGLKFRDSLVDLNTQELTLENLNEEDLAMLPSLRSLKKLHLVSPLVASEKVFALKEQFPETEVTWEVYIDGEMYHSHWAEESLDLSELEIDSIQELEEALSYLPQVTQIFLGEQELENEDLAQYRSRVRDQYKVVWEIRLGDEKGFSGDPKGLLSDPIRTDITFFFPGRDCHKYNLVFNDKTSYNLRYCEDLICVDVGHLGVSDTSFLEGLTNLEYLILAHTGVTKIDGIENCKKLKFLELDWTGIRDLAPLKECTALEDLNFGKTWPDVSVLFEMPWLKNIYMIFGDRGDAYKLSQALPNTRVVASGNVTVAGGWRNLPNYYAMRDALGAEYMPG